MKKYLWILGFLFISSPSFAEIKLEFHDKQAQELWDFLEHSKESGGFVIFEGTMGSSHLSSPVLKCHQISPANFNPPKHIKDPSLYSCDITLGLDAMPK